MKTISLFKVRGVITYPFIFGFYLFFIPALARTALPLHAKTTNESFCALAPLWQLQQQTVTGTITHNNMPMTGVTITVKGKNIVAVSDENGKFTITANGTNTLIFEYLGFKTQILAINNKTNLTVQLEEDVNDLKEVTVNAGYYTVKESERTGNISKISAKDIEKQPVTNVLAAMQGRMAGVNITQDSGMPGGGFNIRIRGRNSLRSDGGNPLYIIDGVPYASDGLGSGYTSGNMASQASPLNNINPADIESVEVLKDADATAIYGSRGANGVVLVTTKKGKEGKTVFTAGASSGFGQVTRFMDLMDTSQYLEMRREALANDGVTTYPATAYDVNGTWDPNRDTDWQKVLVGGTADFTTVNASLSGGSAQTQFLLGGNFSKETTVFPGNFRYLKGNGHLKISHESLDKNFRINFSGSYTIQDNSLPSADLMGVAVSLAPNAPALYDNSGNLNWENGSFQNPLAPLGAKFRGHTYDLIANTLLSYRLPLGFEIKSSFGYNKLDYKESTAFPSTIYNPSLALTSAASERYTNTTGRKSWIAEPQLGWKKTFGPAKLDLLAGATFQQLSGSRVIDNAYGFASNALIENPASAAYYLVLESDASVYKYQAFFGRANINWAGRYILNATGRRDGSSRFGTANRFANFGAVGAAWLFSEEALLKNRAGFLSFGKLRASYGITGNDQIGDYQYIDTYTTSGSYLGTAGLSPSRLFNPAFGWETNRKLEVALETGFFADRLFLTAAWYRNRSSSQLVGLPLPGTTGFASLQANLDAEVENSGLELSLHSVNIKTKTFSWSTDINFTSTKNKLNSFPDLEGSTYKHQYIVGQPLGIVKLYHFTGIDPETGKYTFTDYNGDGKISAPEDKQQFKDLTPEYYGGLQNQLRYGNVQLDFLFQFVKQLGYNQSYGAQMPGTMRNQPAAAADRWQQPGDAATYQLYSNGAVAGAQIANVQYGQSDAAISDASCIRLKNIALSFDLPQRWTKGIRAKLGLQGQNMLTFTSYKGADPEFRLQGFLPPLKVFTTSLQLTF